MLQTLFYACLRASEFCALDDEELDLKSLTILVKNGKGGQDGIDYISSRCANTLRQYLGVRPSLLIDGQKPLLFTDYGQRWNRMALYRMFAIYKQKLESRNMADYVHFHVTQ